MRGPDSDAIASLGFANELANYGEYSGAPNEEQTYEYSKTILNLMTRTERPDGKVACEAQRSWASPPHCC